MNILPSHFDRDKDSLIYLLGAEFAKLQEAGWLEYAVPAGLQESGDGLAILDDPEAGPPWYDFGNDPEAALNRFLDNARWIKPGPDPEHEIALVDPAPLRALILRQRAQARQQLRSVPLREFSKRDANPLGFRMLPPVQKAVGETGSFLGLAGICKCGEPECGSAFAWIEDRVILLSIDTVADSPYSVRILTAVIGV